MLHFRKVLAMLLVFGGVALHAYAITINASLDKEGMAGFLLGVFIWLCSPYIICGWMTLPKEKYEVTIGGLSAIFLLDLYNYHSVFVEPETSTAALNLVFLPLFHLTLFLPLGMMFGKTFVQPQDSDEERG